MRTDFRKRCIYAVFVVFCQGQAQQLPVSVIICAGKRNVPQNWCDKDKPDDQPDSKNDTKYNYKFFNPLHLIQ